MGAKRFFFNIYEQAMGWRRMSVILLLLFLGSGVLYYFNQLARSLEEREEKYAKLYAESLRFFIEKALISDCDYTFVQEVLTANETIPTVLVVKGEPNKYSNIPELDDSTRHWTDARKKEILLKKISEMRNEHPPISVDIGTDTLYVYYSNSLIVKQLRYFPYVLIAAFFVFGSLAFIAYKSSQRAEENRVWVGLAKETAHQLGTPISGLMGWIEVLKTTPNFDPMYGEEMLKDIQRLETITTRFSNIGSVPQMKDEDLAEIVETTIGYLERRISRKVKWFYANHLVEGSAIVRLNRPLFEWVIENLCKNAVDAMAGVGELHIAISLTSKNRIAIDIRDTGKGITKSNLRKIFRAGFSTKKRGWGLGLTLAKRIVEIYHDGRLYVKETQLDKGTTFRIEI